MFMINLLLFSDTMQILSIANNHLEEAMPVGRAVEELISLKSLGIDIVFPVNFKCL